MTNRLTAPQQKAPRDPGRAPSLGPLAMARWAWRQLTSMRTALLLLFALAVAAIPGSLVPQRGVNPVEVAAFAEENPALAEWYHRFGLFDVYQTPWFAAIYLALMVSLIGCIVPRTIQHARVLRARPPKAPRNLDRLPEYRTWTSDEQVAPDQVLSSAAEQLRRKRYRVVVDEDSVAAERGYLREVGNLVFHIAVTVVLIGVAVGSLFGHRGTALVVVGDGFANSVTQYDDLETGRFFDTGSLPPFALTVNDFEVEFATGDLERGSPRDFDADITYTREPGAAPQDASLRVNHPLQISGTQVHLLNHGYAPRFTVRDGAGEVAFAGPVPFIPQDLTFISTGVVKVPDALPDQLGFEGFFLPTAAMDPERGPHSAFPDALNPAVYLTAFRGDLGMDDGSPESVYELDTSAMEQMREGGEPFRVALTPGEEVELPNGAGTLTFEGFDRWVNLQMSANPGEPIALAGGILAVLGVLGSLFIARRRVWVRVYASGGRSVVEVAGLDRGDGRAVVGYRHPDGQPADATVSDELGAIADELGAVAPVAAEPDTADASTTDGTPSPADPRSTVSATDEETPMNEEAQWRP